MNFLRSHCELWHMCSPLLTIRTFMFLSYLRLGKSFGVSKKYCAEFSLHDIYKNNKVMNNVDKYKLGLNKYICEYLHKEIKDSAFVNGIHALVDFVYAAKWHNSKFLKKKEPVHCCWLGLQGLNWSAHFFACSVYWCTYACHGWLSQ